MPLGANKVALYGASADTGSAVLLSTATASSSASISFTLPTAYKQVKFGFYNITPATDNSNFQFDCSVSSSYGTTKTTTFFNAFQTEADTGSGLSYDTGADLAQSTSYQPLAPNVGNGAWLLYPSDAADDLPCVDLGGRRILKKKKKNNKQTRFAVNSHIITKN